MSDEKAQFTIGDFTFQTFHEYRDAQEDLKKIEAINKELDIHDPETAVRLYTMIRSGKITFKSPIGEQFFDHVSDIVADKSEGLLEDKAAVEEVEGHVRYQKYIGIALAAFAVVLFAYFGYRQISDLMTARQMRKMAETTEQSRSDAESTGTQSSGSTDSDPFARSADVDASTLTVLPEYQELFRQNSDMVGWLSIADTDINYPVVQKKLSEDQWTNASLVEQNNSYYLTHGFNGEEDANGTLFVDCRSDIVNPTTNTIIYGHNMKSGLMFGTLKNYLDYDYYQAHKTVTFNTIYEKRQYEIVAVCLSQVEDAASSDYRYYNFINAENEAEWDAFTANVKSLSVFDETPDLTAGDKILTLSTCNNYVESGRLFLVAKRIY